MNPVNDYFALEPLLLQQISEQVPNLQHVGMANSIEQLIKDRGRVPSVYLILANLQPLDTDEQTRRLYEMELTYQVVIAVSHRSETRHGSDVHRVAGPLLATVSKAVTNQQVHQDFTRLVPARSPDFKRYVTGHGLFGLAFSTRFASQYEANLP